MSLSSPQSPSDPQSLAQRISAEIQKSSGWLRFDRYMTMALYEPGLGYYSRPRSPFGKSGDFVTAPSISEWYGQCLARQIFEVLDAIGSDQVLEFGAGDGTLAGQILNHAHELKRPLRYQILELSAPLRQLQAANLASVSNDAISPVQWLDTWPAAEFCGVMLAHEVLDAMPVRLFVHRLQAGQAHWFERGISEGRLNGGMELPQHGPWYFADHAADAAWADRLNMLKSACQLQWLEDWPDGMLIEWHEQAQAWIRSVSGLLRRGLLLLVDYGFPAHEYYLPQREQGTLMTHYRHRAGTDVLAGAGEQDLSVHVDFTALARVAIEQGMVLSGYCAQARFLINTGLIDSAGTWARAQSDLSSAAALARLAGVQCLLSEAEMGELFKFMALTRGLDGLDLIGFRQGDRSGRLGLQAC